MATSKVNEIEADDFCPECLSLLYPIEIVGAVDEEENIITSEKSAFNNMDPQDQQQNTNNLNTANKKTINNKKNTTSEEITKNIYMTCHECNYKRIENTFSTVHFSKLKQKDNKSDIFLDKSRLTDLLYDKTYQRSTKIKCENPNCKPINTKTNNKDHIPPHILLITSNKHPEIGYICSACHHIWGRY